jgi:hypothetical protein
LNYSRNFVGFLFVINLLKSNVAQGQTELMRNGFSMHILSKIYGTQLDTMAYSEEIGLVTVGSFLVKTTTVLLSFAEQNVIFPKTDLRPPPFQRTKRWLAV